MYIKTKAEALCVLNFGRTNATPWYGMVGTVLLAGGFRKLATLFQQSITADIIDRTTAEGVAPYSRCNRDIRTTQESRKKIRHVPDASA
jgi:hypothetical protein